MYKYYTYIFIKVNWLFPLPTYVSVCLYMYGFRVVEDTCQTVSVDYLQGLGLRKERECKVKFLQSGEKYSWYNVK